MCVFVCVCVHARVRECVCLSCFMGLGPVCSLGSWGSVLLVYISYSILSNRDTLFLRCLWMRCCEVCIYCFLTYFSDH